MEDGADVLVEPPSRVRHKQLSVRHPEIALLSLPRPRTIDSSDYQPTFDQGMSVALHLLFYALSFKPPGALVLVVKAALAERI